MWANVGERYFTTEATSTDLPTGLYEVERNWFETLLRKQKVQDEKFIPLGIRKRIIDGVANFRSCRDKYDEFGFTFKRGYLFYGPPGTGKTALLREIVKQNPDVVGLSVHGVMDIKMGYELVRKNEPERTIVFCMEDVEGMVCPELTNIMDGNSSYSNVIFLATTNYMRDIEPRIIRAGRFDELIRIEKLDSEERYHYILTIIDGITKEEAEAYSRETEGMTIAEIRNHVINNRILGKANVVHHKIRIEKGESRGYDPWDEIEEDESDCKEPGCRVDG